MINVIIAEDHPMMVESLERSIQTNGNMTVSGVARDGKTLLEMPILKSADILLLDLDLPEINGIRCAQIIRESYPEVSIVIVSMSCSEKLLDELMPSGIKGYILKSNTGRSVSQAIELVYEGEQYFDDEVMEIVRRHYQNTRKHKRRKKAIEFGDQQLKVAQLLIEDYTTEEIADYLNISPSTVRNIRSVMYEKTGTRTPGGLAAWLISKKIVKPEF